jgi:hypothetical protein
MGRKFRSDQSVEVCVETFRELVAEQLAADVQFFSPQWADATREAPAALIGATATRSAKDATYLAVWDTGATREMYFVAPDYATRPTPPLVGAWKMRDQSLASVGSVTSFRVQS